MHVSYVQSARFAVAAAVTMLVLSACNSSGGGSSNQDNLRGTAAVGAPVVGGTVTARCADGSGFTQAVATASDGSWSGTVDPASLPCALRVTGGDPEVTLHSYAVDAGVVNITPLTDLIVASASARLPQDWYAAEDWPLDEATLDSSRAAIVGALINAGYELPEGDPLQTAFVVGDAWDRVLDQVGEAIANDPAIEDYEALLTLIKDGNLGIIPAPMPEEDGSQGPEDSEAQSGLDVLTAYADTYTVSCTAVDPVSRGTATREHARGTIIIGADGSIDFDTGIGFSAAEINAIFDRTFIDGDARRVHVNYDADDSGRRLEIFLDADLEVTEISYRDGQGGLTRAAIGGEGNCAQAEEGLGNNDGATALRNGERLTHTGHVTFEPFIDGAFIFRAVDANNNISPGWSLSAHLVPGPQACNGNEIALRSTHGANHFATECTIELTTIPDSIGSGPIAGTFSGTFTSGGGFTVTEGFFQMQ